MKPDFENNLGPDNLGAALPTAGFVRLPTILKLIPIGRTTFFEMVSRGEFARPVKLGSRISAWRVEDVRAFIVGQHTI